MKQKTDISDFVSKKTFAQIEEAFLNNFALGLETCDIRGRQVASLCSKNCQPEFCQIVKSSPSGEQRCRQDRMRSMNIAFETGQPYICICHAGIVLGCVPVMDGDIPLGGVFFGKCLWEPANENLVGEINKRLKGIRLNRRQLNDSINKLTVVSGRNVHKATEFLFILMYQMTGLDPRVVRWRSQRSAQQAEIAEIVREQKQKGEKVHYPLEREKELINKVKIGDRIGAREILNTILAAIMLSDPGDLNVLKARMLELLSILSRSAVEGGVDINFLLERNLQYINRVMEIDNQQDLCVWIGSALNDFIELVYSSQDSRKITQVKPAVEYIEKNYAGQISLAEIARAAHLSVSRLAHLFKEQLGITIIDYLTGVRIEHAKQMLLSTNKSCTEICFEVGYNNQSYFTRTFKDIVGLTPRQFREQNNRRE